MIERQPRPQLGDPMASSHPSEETLELLSLRRSSVAATLGEPGPDSAVLERMLQIASRVPDHRRVVPYRFIRFTGEARAAAGQVIAAAYKAANPDASDEAIALEAGRFLRAPVVIAVVSSPNREHKTPEWEQLLCAGAVCQNLMIAASASGFAAQWLTEWYAYDAAVSAGFGLKEGEAIAGYIYIGTAGERPLERPRVEAADITTDWQG